MNPLQFSGLLMIWLLSTIFVITLICFELHRFRFTFNILFSIFFLLIFYSGFPLTSILVFRFGITVVPPIVLMQTLLSATCFYGVYYVIYKTKLKSVSFDFDNDSYSLFTMNKVEAHLTWILLMGIALACVTIFFIHNGFLLFQLHSYDQISSEEVLDVALKRFFYFFIPAMLMLYFLQQEIKTWLLFLVSTISFGLLTYIIVGGTRANIIISFIIFLFIGTIRGWILTWMFITLGALGIIVMFWLALERYKLNVSGNEAFYTFLYLTRDTFSPWENLALLLQNYNKIKLQGLAPIVRDFYVFIPNWLWSNRPKIVLNTANYFTWEVLNNYSGIAISPTLIGSLVIMGGSWLIVPGTIIVGLIIKWFDWLYIIGIGEKNRYKAAILQSFCFSAIFSIIVLVREGVDAFVSHMVFFMLIFGTCLVLAKLLYWLFHNVGLICPREISRLLSQS